MIFAQKSSMKQIICPISTEKIDSNISRLTVFLSVVFMALFLITKQPFYIVFPTFDIAIRAIFSARYSPLTFISTKIVEASKSSPKSIGLAKKCPEHLC